MSRPVDISSLLPALFSGEPLEKRLRETSIWRVWGRAVGEQISAKAHPVALRDGVLTVAVTSAPWLQQLGFMKRQIVEAVNGAIGEPLVRDIYLKAGRPTAAPPPKKAPAAPFRELTSEDSASLDREAAAITDDDLRAAFRRCHEAYLKLGSPPSKEK